MLRSRLMSYVIAVLSVLITLFVSLIFHSLADLAPLLVFIPAVAFSAVYGGLGPGLLATALSTLATSYYFLPPDTALSFDWSIWQRVGLFTAVALLISWLQETRRKIEKSANEQAYLSATILTSIGDAVIATDFDGRVRMMNPVSEVLTGWKQQEAMGQAISRIVNIVDEDTSQPVTNTISQVLSEGTVVSSANHTVLLGRDGTKTPIDNKGAPIRDSRGRVIGAVLVFRSSAERRKAERALEESEARFRTVANNAPVMIWMSDATFQFTFFNQFWTEFTGRTLEQERSNGWTEGIHAADRETCLSAYRAAFEQRLPLRIEFRLRRNDGEYRWVLATGMPHYEADGSFVGFIGGCLDITERKTIEDVQRFLSRASTVLASSLDYEATLQSVARLAVPELADWCAIEVVDNGGSLRQLAVAHVDPAKVALARELRQRYPPDGKVPGIGNEILQKAKSQLVSTVTNEMLVVSARDADHLRILRELGLRSYMVVPIIVRGRVLGMILLVSAESERHFNLSDLSQAEELARRAALAMENARLYNEAQQARRDAELAIERIARSQAVTSALSAALTTAEVAEVVITKGMPSVNAAGGTLYMLHDDGKALELVKSFGFPEDFIEPWQQFSIDSAVPSADAVRSGRPIWIESRQTAELLYPVILESKQPYNAWAAIPLMLENRVLGSIALCFTKEQEFREDDKAFIMLLVQKCAQALDRALLFEAEREARSVAERTRVRLAFMVEASTLLTSSLDYESRMVYLANLVVPSLADACMVDVVDDDGSIRRMAVAARDPAKKELLSELRDQYPPTWGRSRFLTDVLRSGEPRIYSDVGDAVRETVAYDPEHLRLLQGLAVVSALAVPIVARGRTLGVVTLLSAESGRHYGPDDVTLAQELARRAGLAVDNARLYRESREQRERMRVTLESIGDAVIATNTQGRVTFMNTAAEELTGWKKTDAMGESLSKVFMIINESTRESVDSPVDRVIRDGAVIGLANHTLLIRQDATELPIDDSAAPIRDEDGTLFGVILVFRDVSERRKGEARFQATLERTQDLYEICREIGLVYTPPDVLQALLKSRYARQISQVAIMLFDRPWRSERPQHFEVMAIAHADEPLLGFNELRSLEDSPLANLLTRNQPLLIEDARTDNRLDETLRATCEQMGISSIMMFPLAAGGEWFGLLALYYTVPYRGTEDDLRHIRIFSDQISVAMDNVRLFAAEANARREAEEANQVKLKFLAMISHELRTPLTSIKGFATTLLATDVEWDAETQRDFVATISEEADKLSDLIEQLLDLSRLQAGSLRIQPEPKYLGDIVGKSLAQLESITHQHQLVIDIPDNLPLVMVDPHRVGQVIVNLVENSAKYAPEGTTITITAQAQASIVRVNVKDEGPGIPIEDRQKVFEPFRQSETAIAQKSKGAGLGLAICRGLIEAHGGRIWVADGASPGATLSFTLPITATHYR